MKKNPAFAHFLRSTIAAGLGKIDALDNLGHPFLRGRLREVFIQDILRAMTPEIFGILSGRLIDGHGMESAETDVIVFQKNYLPFIPIDQETALIPIENCRYAMEIKTNLRSSTIKSTIIKAKKFAALVPDPKLYSQIRFVLIGIESSMKNKEQWMADLGGLFPDTPVKPLHGDSYKNSMFPVISIIVTQRWYIYSGQRNVDSNEIGWQVLGACPSIRG